MTFSKQILAITKKNNSSVLVGFDPVLDQIPKPFLQAQQRKSNGGSISSLLTTMYCAAIDALAKDICGIKPNSAFFEQYGVQGMEALQQILLYAQKKKIPTVLDAKRGDIGSTAAAYANAVFQQIKYQGKVVPGFPADSLTVNPFLGFDTLEPFVSSAKKEGKGIFVLLSTSNPGSVDIQEKVSDSIIRWILKQYEGGFRDIGVVVGATRPDKIASIRSALPQTLFLIPGVGAQGATPQDVVSAYIGKNEGALINSSRGIFSIPKTAGSVQACLDAIVENARTLKSALNSAQKQGASLHGALTSSVSEYEAEVLLLSAFQLLDNKKQLNRIKDQKVGDFWQSSWIRAPFEEVLTFKQIFSIGFENLIKKRSMNADKMVALSKAINSAAKLKK